MQTQDTQTGRRRRVHSSRASLLAGAPLTFFVALPPPPLAPFLGAAFFLSSFLGGMLQSSLGLFSSRRGSRGASCWAPLQLAG